MLPKAWDGYNFSLSDSLINLDTLPSEYLSATYKLSIYNPKTKDLCLPRIFLQSKGALGFSINLNGSSATSFERVSIPAQDSLLLFVRAFLPLGKDDAPTEVTDSVLFIDYGGAKLSIPVKAIRQNVDHLNVLSLKTNLLRDSKRPWLISDSVVVEQGATLTLRYPAQIWFKQKAYMRVKGKLLVQGTARKPVRFCGTRWDKFIPLVPYSRLTAQWGGLFFDKGAKASLNYLDLLNARWGMIFPLENEDEAIAKISHCKISNIKGVGIRAGRGQFLIEDSEISNTLGSSLYLCEGKFDIKRSSIINYYPWPTIRSDQAIYFREQGAEQGASRGTLSLSHCVVDGEMPVSQLVLDGQTVEVGGELNLVLDPAKSQEPSVILKHCFLRTRSYKKESKVQISNCLFRDERQSSEEIYQAVGLLPNGKKDYFFNFSPKTTAPFLRLGEDGSTFRDLNGQVREKNMTYGAYTAP